MTYPNQGELRSDQMLNQQAREQPNRVIEFKDMQSRPLMKRIRSQGTKHQGKDQE